ncbi:MAG TPA: hypothetical protein VF116_05280 [Ktedonobacterales bacterium]
MWATLIASAVFTAVFIYVGVGLAGRPLRPYGMNQPTVYGCMFILVLFCAISAGAVSFWAVEVLFSPWQSNGSVLTVVFLTLEGVAAVTAVSCGAMAMATARRQSRPGFRAGGAIPSEGQQRDWALYVVALAPVIGTVSEVPLPFDDQFLTWLFRLVWLGFMSMGLTLALTGYSAFRRAKRTKRWAAGVSLGPVGAAYLFCVGITSGLLIAVGLFVEIPILVRLLPAAIALGFALLWTVDFITGT